MRLLAIDPGTRIMGYAFGDTRCARPEFHGVVTAEEKADITCRLSLCNMWLRANIKTRAPDTVIFERPFCRGFHATQALWGLAGIIRVAAFEGDAAVIDVNTGSISKYISAAGFDRGAKKERVMEWAAKLGYRVAHDDEADAIAIWHYGRDKIVEG